MAAKKIEPVFDEETLAKMRQRALDSLMNMPVSPDGSIGKIVMNVAGQEVTIERDNPAEEVEIAANPHDKKSQRSMKMEFMDHNTMYCDVA